jgi:hypothetical protein
MVKQNTGLTKASYSLNYAKSILFLLEISSPSLSKTYRIVNNTVSITSDGFEFQPYPFKLKLAPQGEDSGASIVLYNTTELVQELRNIANKNEDITIKTWVVRASKEDVSERISKGEFLVKDISVSLDTITMGLLFDTSLPYNAGGISINQRDFPNLFL